MEMVVRKNYFPESGKPAAAANTGIKLDQRKLVCAVYFVALIWAMWSNAWVNAHAQVVTTVLAIACAVKTIDAIARDQERRARIVDVRPTSRHIAYAAAATFAFAAAGWWCASSSNDDVQGVGTVANWAAIVIAVAFGLWLAAPAMVAAWSKTAGRFPVGGFLERAANDVKTFAVGIWDAIVWAAKQIVDLHCLTLSQVIPAAFTFGGTPDPIVVTGENGRLAVVHPKNAPPKRFYQKLHPKAKVDRAVRWYDIPMIRPHSEEHIARRGGRGTQVVSLVPMVAVMVIMIVAANAKF